MNARISGGISLAGVLAFGITAFAQTAGQQPTQPQTQPGASSSMEQSVTITGCVEREADYRKAHESGRGGVAGSGMGVGNEFVLSNASSSTSSERTETEATGTSGSASSSAKRAKAYELTGPNEGQVAEFVGRRVEITGKLKAAETSATGQPTGGATAGAPPSGVDVMSKDLKLRELEVTSVREVSGTCPPAK